MKFDLARALWPFLSVKSPLTAVKASLETELDYDMDILTSEEVLSRVVLYNDDYHTFDEVIDQVMKATGCNGSKAESVAWEVHTTGKAVVYEGEIFECLKVSSVLEEIALHTQVLT